MKITLICCSLLFMAAPVFAQTETAETAETPETEQPEASEVTAESESNSDSDSSATETGSDNSVTTDLDAEAQQAVETENVDDVEPTTPARFALVLLGDAASSLREQAQTLRTYLAEAGLVGVADPALRGALWGEAGETDDGLGRVRGARRALTISRDSEPLRLIGRATDADALIVLQQGEAPRVYDVDAGAFFEAVEVRSFARFASRAVLAASERDEPMDRPPNIPTAEETAAASEAAEPETEPAEPPGFLEQNWPYFVVGALLVAGVIWLAVGSSSTDEVPPPVLRFRPGD